MIIYTRIAITELTVYLPNDCNVVYTPLLYPTSAPMYFSFYFFSSFLQCVQLIVLNQFSIILSRWCRGDNYKARKGRNSNQQELHTATSMD